ncbi:MAG: prepilin-type N-terminal cleavage/methylation domain-containing protein [Lacunisphaera sp.]|nr:prepilin-type N-terminal cleavage/methylation domain-containing protein [Lacunisphaera sp.]
MKAIGRENGLTLLELLVAMTITLLLAGIMLSVTTGTLTIWRRTQDNFTSGTAAKLALDLIERDLQSAFYRKDALNNTWLAADVINTAAILTNHGWQTAALMKPATAESQRLVPNPSNGLAPPIAEARFGLSGVWLRFIGTSTDANGSVPVAISYQLARRPVSGTNVTGTNPADVRYTLFRSAVATDATFASGNDVTGATYGSTFSTAGTARAAATLTNPHTTGDALATNVVDFGVWLYVRDNAGALRRIYPAANSDLSHAATDATASGDPNRFPEVADVLVRVLTEEGARLLEAMEKSNGAITRPLAYASDAEWWWGVVEANSRVFVRRVEIKGGAL